MKYFEYEREGVYLTATRDIGGNVYITVGLSHGIAEEPDYTIELPPDAIAKLRAWMSRELGPW